MDYEIQNVDLSRTNLSSQIKELKVGQSFTFPEERISYVRHSACMIGKKLGRTFTVNKKNLSVTRKG